MPRNRRNRCGRLGARAIDSSNPASGSSAANLNPLPLLVGGLDRSAGNLEIRHRNWDNCSTRRTYDSLVVQHYFFIVGIELRHTSYDEDQICVISGEENTLEIKNNFLLAEDDYWIILETLL